MVVCRDVSRKALFGCPGIMDVMRRVSARYLTPSRVDVGSSGVKRERAIGPRETRGRIGGPESLKLGWHSLAFTETACSRLRVYFVHCKGFIYFKCLVPSHMSSSCTWSNACKTPEGSFTAHWNITCSCSYAPHMHMHLPTGVWVAAQSSHRLKSSHGHNLSQCSFSNNNSQLHNCTSPLLERKLLVYKMRALTLSNFMSTWIQVISSPTLTNLETEWVLRCCEIR